MANAVVASFIVAPENGKQNELTFYDPALIQHTKNIMAFNVANSRAVIGKCAEYASMEADGSYKHAGFDSVADYGYTVFGDKRPTVNLYRRIGKYFTIGTGSEVQIVDGLPKELTSGQLLELLPLVTDNGDISACIDAYRNGTLNSRMTTKKTREAVKLINSVAGSARELEEKPADKPADKPVDKPADKPVDQLVDKPADKPAVKVTIKDIYDLYKTWRAENETSDKDELIKRAKLEKAFMDIIG